ncbi:hypothetical protein KAR52_03420 [Candidatus Pacearchaeota archaeon]|nr:hypothetical protein [Candidatus Pacearchaeota archaeon]
MNLKKILRNGLMTVGLSALTLAPLTAEDPSSLIKKIDPTTLMSISGDQEVMRLEYDRNGDGKADTKIDYYFKPTSGGGGFYVKAKDYQFDSNNDGQYDESKAFNFEEIETMKLESKNPADFVKQINPKSLIVVFARVYEQQPIFGCCYDIDGDNMEDLRIIYSCRPQDGKATYVRPKGYWVELDGDNNWSEDEKFLF